MADQQPLVDAPPTVEGQLTTAACQPCPPSSSIGTFLKIVEILIDRFLPPRALCLTFVVLAIVYATPFILQRWLQAFINVKATYRLLQLGYDPVPTAPRVEETPTPPAPRAVEAPPEAVENGKPPT